jgi:hypothetical protein
MLQNVAVQGKICISCGMYLKYKKYKARCIEKRLLKTLHNSTYS